MPFLPASIPGRSDRTPRNAVLIVALGWLALVLVLAVHWSQLQASHRSQLQAAEKQIQLRAAETAHALAVQFDTLIGNADYIARHLAEHWAGADRHTFLGDLALARSALREGTLAHVQIADPDGKVLFSSAGADEAAATPSVAGRAYFQAHGPAHRTQLFISEPLFDRFTRQWTIQLSRPLLRDGQFAGVIAVSITAESLSLALRRIFPGPADVAALVGDDGHYLAHSQQMDEALGQSLPESSPIRTERNSHSGSFAWRTPLDGVLRHFAWQRAPTYPVTVIHGLDKHEALRPVLAVLRENSTQNAFGTALLILVAVAVSAMFLYGHRQGARLAAMADQLELSLEAGGLGTWSWEPDTGKIQFDERWAAMLGYAEDELPRQASTWESRIHPADLQHTRQALDALLQGASTSAEGEYRLRHRDGHWIWVHGRCRIAARARDGRPVQVAGTLQNVSARVAEARLRTALLDQSAAAIALFTSTREIRSVNARAREIFGSGGIDPVGRNVRELGLHVEWADLQTMNQHYATLRAGGQVRCEYPLRDASGRARWFDMHGTPSDPEDPDSDIVWTLIDITERREAETALATERLRMITLLERYPGGVLMEDGSGRVVMVNQKFCTLLALGVEATSLEGLDHVQLCTRLDEVHSRWLHLPDSEHSIEKRRTIEVNEGPAKTLAVEWVPIVRDTDTLGRVWLIRDISERKQREAELARLATTDTLTGLPNRRSFMASLDAAIADVRSHPERSGVLLMMDIDHFKRINDSYGHPVGDAVLQHAAEVIRSSLRQTDSAGRLGGEEFGAVLPAITLQDGKALAERLRRTLAGRPASTDAGKIEVSISIGLTPLTGDDPNLLFSRADRALYAAKNSGRNRVSVSQPEKALPAPAGDGVAQ